MHCCPLLCFIFTAPLWGKLGRKDSWLKIIWWVSWLSKELSTAWIWQYPTKTGCPSQLLHVCLYYIVPGTADCQLNCSLLCLLFYFSALTSNFLSTKVKGFIFPSLLAGPIFLHLTRNHPWLWSVSGFIRLHRPGLSIFISHEGARRRRK